MVKSLEIDSLINTLVFFTCNIEQGKTDLLLEVQVGVELRVQNGHDCQNNHTGKR